MSPNKRRKLSPPVDENADVAGPVEAQAQAEGENSSGTTSASAPTDEQKTIAEASDETATTKPSSLTTTDRQARFAALKARATDSARSNLAAAKAESQRTALDPNVLANLSRRSAIAQHNLLKADTEESGGTGAFERKRAWDYTIEESEKWDERVAMKKANKEKNALQDYSAEAGKIYERQVRELEKGSGKDGGKGRLREDYDAGKAELLENAARNGNLEIVEMQNGEMVAIDRDGRFYADNDSVGFVEQKPKKENVDRLVEDLRKAEEVRMKKRRARGVDVDEGDVLRSVYG